MHWLTSKCCHLLSVALACLGLALGGCQPKAGTVVPVASEQPKLSQVGSDTDLTCSYFYFLWGRHAELLLHFEEALEAYQKALICDEHAEFISEKVPILLLRLERTDEAALWLHDYLMAHPDKTGMRILYAKVLLRQKKNAEAMRQYQLINERHPDDPAILLLLAEMYLADNQLDKAKAQLEQVLALDPASYTGHILMARLSQLQENVDSAVEHYLKALEGNLSSELQLELGELYIKTARYDKAAALFREIIEREENNESARIALVHVYLLQKRDDEALAELNQLKAFADQPQRVDLTIARLYAKQQHYDKAITITEKILAKENLSEARYFLAVLLVNQEKFDKALKQVRLINRRDPEYVDALFLQVRILGAQNKVVAAKRLLEENIKAADIRNAEMYIMLAALHESEGRDDLSKNVLLQGLEVFPENEHILYEYGLLLEDSGDHAAALAIMQKVIELKPDNAAALNFVGYSWADKKINLDMALDYIQRAIALKPGNGYIHDSLGWVYFRLGKLDLAIRELETAVRLSPDDGAILEHLGDVYLESGRVAEALQTYKKAAKFSADNEPDLIRILKKIRVIEKQGIS